MQTSPKRELLIKQTSSEGSSDANIPPNPHRCCWEKPPRAGAEGLNDQKQLLSSHFITSNDLGEEHRQGAGSFSAHSWDERQQEEIYHPMSAKW